VALWKIHRAGKGLGIRSRFQQRLEAVETTAGDHEALLPVNWINTRPATIESRVA
jgi:hypothetical protein